MMKTKTWDQVHHEEFTNHANSARSIADSALIEIDTVLQETSAGSNQQLKEETGSDLRPRYAFDLGIISAVLDSAEIKF